MATDIEKPAKTTEDRAVARTSRARVDARKVVKPLRSIAIFGAVGALVAAVALPAYAASKPAESATTVQQMAAVDAQSLVVASDAAAAPLNRGTFTATTPDEIEKKKAEEAAAARAKAAASSTTATASSNFDIGSYALVSPGSGEVRYPLPQGSYNVSRTVGGAHQGADMLAPAGTPIYAAAAGVVRASAENIGGYGVCVMLDSVVGGQRVQTTYGHMIYGSRQVQAGETVAAGQLIGFVGSTGRSTANHLHFEVWVNGGLMEPIAWLGANAG
ncbi:M23 family metallopeptidase [Microbacterium hydrocarbonoxydans]|uniref:Murein DD-endopeptidase MepM and murein hydrolase activator NlpD, contain LysM domain n=1 Tax=Microbacterium hydrocarbonoxydans TaxID=273678 RepID=A0A1H4K574_9MICO|nr:M23 family metallopeptidase [Microbacterium hydrocarbonoxydans]SEB53245.1 Murein DD-endopeptidase MepM and murein hydrolase activator NlpD, contain LysM domain [Microbacterium hydrocarbonoxydans]